MDSARPRPQLMNTAAQQVGRWPAQFVTKRSKLADACHAFRIRPLLTAAKASEPLQRRGTAVFIPIEDDLRLRHEVL